MDDFSLQQAFELAVQDQKSGRLAESEKICRRILESDPKNVQAMCLLAAVARRTGRNDLAVDLLQNAVALEADSAPIQFNLGNALKDQGKSDLAIEAYRTSIALEPGLAQAHTNLANSLKDAGKVNDAIPSYRIAVALRPGHPQSYNNLGVALTVCGDPEEAISACEKAIELKPDFPEAHANLGTAFAKIGRNSEAKQAYVRAIELRPDYLQVLLDLGKLLCQMRELDEAVEVANKVIVLLPWSHKGHNLLGEVLAEKSEPQPALAAFQKALHSIDLESDAAEVYCNLASAFKDMGQIDEAIEACRNAIRLKPDDAAMHSSLVGILHYHPKYTARTIADELEVWNQRHALPLAAINPTYRNDFCLDRVIRIGYVSPDFRSHVVGRNLLPLFRNHDHGKFHITCYAQVRNADAMTAEYQQLSDCWRNIVGLTDAEVAKQVYDDRIDILVDLSLHTADNRLLVFARKPAPIQVTFAGYPGSTGLTAIDYRISDPYLDPPEIDTAYSERTVLLPDSFWCFDPLENWDIDVNSAPAIANGYITFGCLNNFGKSNDTLLNLWAKVLNRVEGSKLLMLAPVGSHREHVIEQFAEYGIESKRISFVAGGFVRDYLQLYHRIDICLDTFPYNGHSTSLDALWMGVPVITLTGQTVVSRAGWSQLSNIGLEELSARTSERFVEIVSELADDPDRIQKIRLALRSKMLASPLTNKTRFAGNLERIYRQIYEAWVEQQSRNSVTS